jgi:hypothetical protein
MAKEPQRRNTNPTVWEWDDLDQKDPQLISFEYQDAIAEIAHTSRGS